MTFITTLNCYERQVWDEVARLQHPRFYHAVSTVSLTGELLSLCPLLQPANDAKDRAQTKTRSRTGSFGLLHGLFSSPLIG